MPDIVKGLSDWLSKVPNNPAWLVVIGGMFTLLGGYFGSRVLVRDERRRDRKELIAAILMTRSELAANASTIGDKLKPSLPPTASRALSDESFRTAAATLARGLPFSLFGWLGIVNNQVARLREVPNIQGQPKQEMDALKELQERLLIANKMLSRYTREQFGFKAEKIAVDPTMTPAEIEANLESLLFPPAPKWQFWRRQSRARGPKDNAESPHPNQGAP